MVQVLADYENTADILVAAAVCDLEGGSLCDSHSIGGYPEMFTYSPQDKQLKQYNGDRSHSDIVKFITKQLGAPTADVSV